MGYLLQPNEWFCSSSLNFTSNLFVCWKHCEIIRFRVCAKLDAFCDLRRSWQRGKSWPTTWPHPPRPLLPTVVIHTNYLMEASAAVGRPLNVCALLILCFFANLFTFHEMVHFENFLAHGGVGGGRAATKCLRTVDSVFFLRNFTFHEIVHFEKFLEMQR